MRQFPKFAWLSIMLVVLASACAPQVGACTGTDFAFTAEKNGALMGRPGGDYIMINVTGTGNLAQIAWDLVPATGSVFPPNVTFDFYPTPSGEYVGLDINAQPNANPGSWSTVIQATRGATICRANLTVVVQ
jgi:hypothetical protein